MPIPRLARRLGVIVAASVVVVLGAPLAVNAIATDRPVLGLAIADAVDGAGRSEVWSDVVEAAGLVAEHRARTPITVRAGALTRSLTWDDVGLVDVTAELRDALLSKDREGSWWHDAVAQTLAVWGLEQVTPPAPRLDPARLASAIAAIADDVAVAPRDATITADGSTVSITADAPGVEVDQDAAQHAVRDAVASARSTVELPTVAVPATVTATDLAPVVDVLHAAVERPLALAAGDARVIVPSEHLLAALPVAMTAEGATIGTDPTALADDVAALADAVDRDPQPRIVMDGTEVAPGVDGQRLDREATTAAVAAELTARATGGGTDQLRATVTTQPAPLQEAVPGAFGGDQTVHLTFDDGPGAHTEQILDILRDRGVHATFYVVGDRARQHPETVRRILAEGHRLGNHSTTHAKLPGLSASPLRSELADTQALLLEITGVRPTAFRPPYGAVDDAVRAAAAAEHLSVDLWTLDPRDWSQPGAGAVRDRVLGSATPGSVVLLHVLHQDTVDALPQIIDGLRANGLALD